MSGNLDGNFSPGPYCTCNLGFLDHIHTGVKAWISEMCTWLSPHLGHPRTNFKRWHQVLQGQLRCSGFCPASNLVLPVPPWGQFLSCLTAGLNPYWCLWLWMMAIISAAFSVHIYLFVRYWQCLRVPREETGQWVSSVTFYLSNLRCDFTSLSPNGFLCWMRIRFLLNS